MANPLLSKINLLSEVANGHEWYSLKVSYVNMLKYQENFDVAKKGIESIEKNICERIDRDTHQDFYKKLDTVNSVIKNCEKSFLVEEF